MNIGKQYPDEKNSFFVVRKLQGHPRFSVVWMHAAKDGSPVLKETLPWWKTVNGIWINGIFQHRIFLFFRRRNT